MPSRAEIESILLGYGRAIAGQGLHSANQGGKLSFKEATDRLLALHPAPPSAPVIEEREADPLKVEHEARELYLRGWRRGQAEAGADAQDLLSPPTPEPEQPRIKPLDTSDPELSPTDVSYRDGFNDCLSHFPEPEQLGDREAEYEYNIIGAMRRIRELLDERDAAKNRPEIICLCGSSRFVGEMAVLAWEFEKEGKIVFGLHLLPSWYEGAQVADHLAEAEGVADQMDALHLEKIRMADRVFVVNKGGYIGDSTRNEIAFAESIRKPVAYLEPDATQGCRQLCEGCEKPIEEDSDGRLLGMLWEDGIRTCPDCSPTPEELAADNLILSQTGEDEG